MIILSNDCQTDDNDDSEGNEDNDDNYDNDENNDNPLKWLSDRWVAGHLDIHQASMVKWELVCFTTQPRLSSSSSSLCLKFIDNLQ